ncbi:glycine oxidase ThiO [Mesorhizobium sp. SP-1A]|uniref:glycine oxidase ThiO n=1 Tax=Mesorhizobium sp. SP-1A TaxID=3077840 RepID=UPI0028F71DB0|nr:glycine oxidase ThiO [Mesorhizobium sp. SP-1A]
MKVLVKGAGVAGLTAAHELVRRGAQVVVADPRRDAAAAASWYAGGMLAPWCERESAEQPVLDLGIGAADWWEGALPGHVLRRGTLVVAPARDRSELARFASRTGGFVAVDAGGIAELEPDLAGRFREGLHFAAEAHLDPRAALEALHGELSANGVIFDTGTPVENRFDRVIDCTGMARAAADARLRGVRGEMLILRSREVTLSRPVRLLHPRIPLYVVPRSGNRFMVGATMIESGSAQPITARSMMELLNAAYSLHPAFGEAEILETGVGVRPAYADNLPRVEQSGRSITVNGLYRHGFLLAPAMARQAAELAFERSEARELAHETDG